MAGIIIETRWKGVSVSRFVSTVQMSHSSQRHTAPQSASSFFLAPAGATPAVTHHHSQQTKSCMIGRIAIRVGQLRNLTEQHSILTNSQFNIGSVECSPATISIQLPKFPAKANFDVSSCWVEIHGIRPAERPKMT